MEIKLEFSCIIVGVIMTIMMAFGMGYLTSDIMHSPTALEVYQGKTTLEVTSKNGVPIDSVVVYKNRK